MRWVGRFRLVIVYANKYALLLYYDRHYIKLQKNSKQRTKKSLTQFSYYIALSLGSIFAKKS